MSGPTDPASSLDDLAGTVGNVVENAVYTAVGLGLLGFQHLQVQRRELTRALATAARQVADEVGCTAEPRDRARAAGSPTSSPSGRRATAPRPD